MISGPLVILDRDGVINVDTPGEYVKSPEEWVALPGALAAIARLNEAGARVVIASNQSGLARGLFDIAALLAIHEKMERELAEVGGRLEAILFCPHGPRQRCDCRKPKPGMLHEIARRFRVNLAEVPVVGDKDSDIQAARAAGATPVLVRTGRGETTLARLNDAGHVRVYADLAEFADQWIAAQSR